MGGDDVSEVGRGGPTERFVQAQASSGMFRGAERQLQHHPTKLRASYIPQRTLLLLQPPQLPPPNAMATMFRTTRALAMQPTRNLFMRQSQVMLMRRSPKLYMQQTMRMMKPVPVRSPELISCYIWDNC